MKNSLKKLLFIGISKKEEILFKSFFNLTKNELSFDLQFFDDSSDELRPDIILADENGSWSNYKSAGNAVVVLVGSDHARASDSYLVRPVQWSEFKQVVMSYQQSTMDSAEVVLDGTDAESEILQQKMLTEAIDYSDESSYSLEEISSEYSLLTDSEYLKIIDDVKDYVSEEGNSPNDAVILVTDDESASVNSVLVIETSSSEVWEFSESDILDLEINEKSEDHLSETLPPTEFKGAKQIGSEILADEEFWYENLEVIVDGQTFMYVLPEQKQVFSTMEPGKWLDVMQRGGLFKLPLEEDWQPSEKFDEYPIENLVWSHSLVHKTSGMGSYFSDQQAMQLERWPDFALMELDNILLKLATMLFVREESVNSIANKSGYGRSTIRGFMNACAGAGYLKKPSQIRGEKSISRNEDIEMQKKIRETFN